MQRPRLRFCWAQASVVVGRPPVCEEAQAGWAPVLERWSLCWMARALVSRPERLWVRLHVIARQRATEGVVLRGPASAWVQVSGRLRFVSGEAELAQHEAA
ncbi:MAG: hypothetical protein ABL970_08155 [Nitrospira sp.]